MNTLKKSTVLWLAFISLAAIMLSIRPAGAALSVSLAFAENSNHTSGTLTATVTGNTGNVSYHFVQLNSPPDPAVTGLPADIPATGTLTKTVPVTFSSAHAYSFQVSVTDTVPSTATDTANATIAQVPTGTITVTPNPVDLPESGTQTFAAAVDDQFGNPIAAPTVAWSVAGGGTIGAATGIYTAPAAAATATITATDGTATGTATAHVYAAPVVSLTGAVDAAGTGGTLTATVAAGSAPGNLTYMYVNTVHPAGAATITPNPHTVTATTDTPALTFPAIGMYTFHVVVTDALGQTSNVGAVTLTVPQVPTTITVAPASPSVSINGTVNFTATVKDQFGTTFATGVTWAVTSGVGTIGATTGVFGAGTTPGSSTVKASVTSTPSVNQSVTFTVNDIPPTLGAITATPNPVTGTTAALKVTGSYTGSGNLSYAWSQTSAPAGGSVTFSPNPVTGAPGAQITTTATFTKAGSYTVKAIVTDAASNSSAPQTLTFTVDQTLTSITVTRATPTVVVANTDQFTAVGLDQFGDALTTQPTFTWTTSSAGGGTVSGTGLFTAPTNIANNNTNNTETDSVTAASGVVMGSANVTVDPDVSRAVSFVAVSSPVVAGAAFTVTVKAVDVHGNNVLNGTGLNLTLSAKPTGSTGLVVSNSPRTTTNGVATFSATIDTGSLAANDYTLKAQASDAGTAQATQTLTVYSAAPNKLSLTGPAVPVAGDVSLQLTVQDSFGNTVGLVSGGPNYGSVTVSFTASDLRATAPAAVTFDHSDTTTYTRSVTATLRAAVTQSVTATAGGLALATYTITVTAAPATQFVLNINPSFAGVGIPRTVTFTAQDPFFNIDTTYAGTITPTSSDLLAVFSPGPITASSGQGTFTVTLNTVGNEVVTVTGPAAGGGTISGAAVAQVTTGALDHFVVTAPAAATTTIPVTVTVTAKDAGGNTVNVSDPVAISSTDTTATFAPAALTFTAGVATVQATFFKPGAQTISVEDTNNIAVTGVSGVVTVSNPTLTVSGPAVVTATVPAAFTVTATDTSGNPINNYTAPLTVGNTGGLTATATPNPVTLANGSATFSLTFTQAGTTRVSLTEPRSNATASSAVVTVAYPSLTVSVPNNAATNFISTSLTITAVDANGTILRSFPANQSISIVSSDPTTTFGPTDALSTPAHPFVVTAVNGTVTTSVRFNGIPAAAPHLTATYAFASPSLVTGMGDSGSVTITNPTPQILTVAPPSVQANSTGNEITITGTGFVKSSGSGTGLSGQTRVLFDNDPIPASQIEVGHGAGAGSGYPIDTLVITNFNPNFSKQHLAGTYNLIVGNPVDATHYNQGVPSPFSVTGLNGLTPTIVTVGDPAFTSLGIVGAGFAPLANTTNFDGRVEIAYDFSSLLPSTLATPASIVYDSAHPIDTTPGTTTTVSTPALLTVGLPTPTAGQTAGAVPYAGTYTVTVTQTGASAQTARLTALALRPSDNDPVSAAAFQPGLQLISAPFDYDPDVAGNVPLSTDLIRPFDVNATSNPFGSVVNFAVWNPTSTTYNTDIGGTITPASNAAPDPSKLIVGQGYWTRVASALSLIERGRDATEVPQSTDLLARGYNEATNSFAIPLVAGWNMIGDPFNNNVSLANFQVYYGKAPITKLSLTDANIQGVMSDILYRYDSTSNQYVAITTRSGIATQDASLHPYVGYWVLSYQACTLYVSGN